MYGAGLHMYVSASRFSLGPLVACRGLREKRATHTSKDSSASPPVQRLPICLLMNSGRIPRKLTGTATPASLFVRSRPFRRHKSSDKKGMRRVARRYIGFVLRYRYAKYDHQCGYQECPPGNDQQPTPSVLCGCLAVRDSRRYEASDPPDDGDASEHQRS